MTPEEIEEMEASIPEWKRQALVIQDKRAQKEKGMFGRMKERITTSDAAQRFYESEDYDKLKDMRSNYNQFKSNLQDGIETTQSPTLQRTVQVVDMARAQSPCGRAIIAMQ